MLLAKQLGIVDRVLASQLKLEYIHTSCVVDNNKFSTSQSVETRIYCYQLSS